MAGKLIVPMTILAQYVKDSVQVPALAPNYKTALHSYLGKDSTPAAFNTDILLKKGVHLHFVLPSAWKKGCETDDGKGGKKFDYPAVPDRYLVTRMYVENNQVITDCHLVESNFYSLDDSYHNSITVPKFDDLRARRRYRYMGRNYPACASVPKAVGESGYFEKITALGGGDPIFSAYYPSCSSVFGYYDGLDGVPKDAVLTYFILGYYSNVSDDIFSGVKTKEDMETMLEKYNLKTQEGAGICNSCVLFGEVGGIRVGEGWQVPVGAINIGVGKSSAEALSAIIKNCYYQDSPQIERTLTSIQYDTADESAQPDGNYKIDDDIHLRGFSRLDPLETSFAPKLPKNGKKNEFDGLAGQFSKLLEQEREAGRLRRNLEYKKKSLYELWEIYEGASSTKKSTIKGYIDPLIQNEIPKLRSQIVTAMEQRKQLQKGVQAAIDPGSGELTETAPEPFYLPKDPVVMLFGEGMNRTYAFGEDGRFEDDHTLFCQTKALDADLTIDQICTYFKAMPDVSNTCRLHGDYQKYAAMAVLLDTANILPKLNLKPVIQEKYSPVLYNANPSEQVTLLMQWESAFYPDYGDADPKESRLEYGETDYVYQRAQGGSAGGAVYTDGVTVLTPHGVYNLQEKIEKYLKRHSGDPDIASIAAKIKDIAAVSQSLGGFSSSLAALAHAYQYPIDIDPADGYAKAVAECLSGQDETDSIPLERLAVRENTPVFPLREGFFGLSKLAITTSFGLQRMLLDDELAFKGQRYISENLYPAKDGLCFLPLALTSPARLLADFVSADDEKILSSQFPGATPVIGIFLPDMLNRNLNVFSNAGVPIGMIKTVYREIQGKKRAVGRFVKQPGLSEPVDTRIQDFINVLTQDNCAFSEVMNAIEDKLGSTLPQASDRLIFGRALVLAQAAVQLEFFGHPEWSKKDADIGKFDDMGLSKQKFPVLFGDKGRVMDGLCCGFYDGFSKAFPAFGEELADAGYLNAQPFSICASEGRKMVYFLFDPMLKITVHTGILPDKQLEIAGEHTDFSDFSLYALELDHLISGQDTAGLPDFAQGEAFYRYYPKYKEGEVCYGKLEIQQPSTSIELLEKEGGLMITDGVVSKRITYE